MSDPIEELYKEVNRVVEELTEKLGRRASLREALVRLVQSKALEPSDFTWSWRMTKVNSKNIHPMTLDNQAMIHSENQSEKKSP